MTMMEKKEIIRNITLMLLYLNVWLEDKRNVPGAKVLMAHLGPYFGDLNELEAKEFIHQTPGGLSIRLEEEGRRQALVLKQKHFRYLIPGPVPPLPDIPALYMSKTKRKALGKTFCCTQAPTLPITEAEKKELKKELALLFIYLTAKEEYKRNAPGEKEFWAWRHYNPECIAEMREEQLLSRERKHGGVFFTAKGIAAAHGLLGNYLKYKPIYDKSAGFEMGEAC